MFYFILVYCFSYPACCEIPICCNSVRVEATESLVVDDIKWHDRVESLSSELVVDDLGDSATVFSNEGSGIFIGMMPSNRGLFSGVFSGNNNDISNYRNDFIGNGGIIGSFGHGTNKNDKTDNIVVPLPSACWMMLFSLALLFRKVVPLQS